MVKICENCVNCAEFMDTLNRYSNSHLIGQSAMRIKTLWGIVAPTTKKRKQLSND